MKTLGFRFRIVLAGDVTAISNTASKPDPLTTSNRMYRVRVLP